MHPGIWRRSLSLNGLATAASPRANPTTPTVHRMAVITNDDKEEVVIFYQISDQWNVAHLLPTIDVYAAFPPTGTLFVAFHANPNEKTLSTHAINYDQSIAYVRKSDSITSFSLHRSADGSLVVEPVKRTID
jgi:hypothetical protein